MYTSFRVQNFRGFEDLHLDDLARVNLIAGKNNTGKTALLEAIALHTGMYDPDILLRLDISALARERSHLGLPDWDIIFNDFDISRNIIIKGHLPQKDVIELTIYKRDFSSVPEQEISIIPPFTRLEMSQVKPREIDIIELSSSTGYQSFMFNYRYKVFLNEIIEKLIPSKFLFTHTLPSLEENARLFSNLQRNRNTKIILETLQLVDSSISGLEILYRGYPPLIYAEVGLMQPVPLSSMGDGLNRILSIVLAMSDTQDGVILIDEIENGLHHSVQEDFWRAIAEAAERFNVQVFATTHSREMAMAAHRAFEARDEYDFRYHRLDRNKKTGQIYPTTYDQLTMNDAMEMGAEVR